MTHRQLDEERIFNLARQQPNADAVADYLDQVCAGDQALRERVEELLRVHQQNQSFLKSNSAPPPTEAMGELNIAAGQQIGRYKLLQKIGEGGFGVVFMAEQSRPVRRKVALKVIKPGMDSEAVVARFEAERQALAMMDHPNIARVFDGGATEGQRPYFVMELVKGVPITEYCDKNELATEQRLKLFITVCQAVQHAHQKGIIHRDLKPSNVLVTLADGEPVVKVIDFGVAKATNQQLTEKTLFTAYGQMVGTPQYMSPEQAEMSCLDVDTRSDVYSLGVLLYELLTGTTPLEAERLRTAGYAEMQRLIREEEPPKPSTRLSTSGDKLTILAKHRKVTPEKLKSLVKGDLDWIVMKALEKERTRRYESPGDLSDDVSNYLEDEPVDARPPTWGYRLSKYGRRNRVAISVALLLFLTLSLGLFGTSWQAREAALARNQVQDKLEQTHKLLVERAFLQSISGEFAAARETLQIADSAGVREEWLCLVQGSIAFHEGKPDEAIEELERARDLAPDNVAALALLSYAYVFEGRWNEWSRIAIKIEEAEPGSDYPVIDKLFLGYANFYLDYEVAAKLIEEVLIEHPSWFAPRIVMASALAHQARKVEKAELLRAALREIEQCDVFADDNPYLILVKLFIYDGAIELQSELEEDEVRDAIARANDAADLLARYPKYQVGSLIRHMHWTAVNNPAKLKQAADDLFRYGTGSFLEGPLADLALQQDYQSIYRINSRGPEVEIAKAFVLAMDGQKDEALSIYHRLKAKHDTWYMRYRLIEIPLFVGEQPLAVHDATSWLANSTGCENGNGRFERARIEAVANGIKYQPDFQGLPAQGFLRNYLLGIDAIGQKKFGSAEKAFEDAILADKFESRYFWAEVFREYARNQANGERANSNEVGQEWRTNEQ